MIIASKQKIIKVTSLERMFLFVYVGTGKYKRDASGKWIEAKSGREGQDPFSN